MNKKYFVIFIAIVIISTLYLFPLNKTNSITTNYNNYYSSKTVETIKFDKNTYNCTKGASINATITADGSASARVRSYRSSNTLVANIQKNPNYTLKCFNCLAVRINCKKAGTVTLTAKSTTGAITKAKVKVTNPTIKFAKTSYTCKTGTSFTTLISASDLGRVKSYKSNNTSIATIKKNPTSQVKCINCLLVRVYCKKAGTTKLSATSSEGAQTSVKLTVKK